MPINRHAFFFKQRLHFVQRSLDRERDFLRVCPVLARGGEQNSRFALNERITKLWFCSFPDKSHILQPNTQPIGLLARRSLRPEASGVNVCASVWIWNALVGVLNEARAHHAGGGPRGSQHVRKLKAHTPASDRDAPGFATAAPDLANIMHRATPGTESNRGLTVQSREGPQIPSATSFSETSARPSTGPWWRMSAPTHLRRLHAGRTIHRLFPLQFFLRHRLAGNDDVRAFLKDHGDDRQVPGWIPSAWIPVCPGR